MSIRVSICLIVVLLCSGRLSAKPEAELHSRSTIFSAQDEVPAGGICEDSLLLFRSGKGYVPMLLGNFIDQAKFPLRLSESQCLMLMGIAGLTASVHYYDSDIDRKFSKIRSGSGFVRDINPHVSALGEYYGYGIVAGLGITGALTKNRKLLHTSLLASQAGITAGVWVRGVKILTSRMRPVALDHDAEYRGDHWFGPFGQFNDEYREGRSIDAFSSFPSGHTAAAFSIATVFASMYSEHKAIPVILYSLSGIVALTRVVEHEHWASDLLPGALIGYSCGKQVVRRYKELFPENARSVRSSLKSRSNLFISSGNSGLRLHYSLTF